MGVDCTDLSNLGRLRPTLCKLSFRCPNEFQAARYRGVLSSRVTPRTVSGVSDVLPLAEGATEHFMILISKRVIVLSSANFTWDTSCLVYRWKALEGRPSSSSLSSCHPTNQKKYVCNTSISSSSSAVVNGNAGLLCFFCPSRWPISESQSTHPTALDMVFQKCPSLTSFCFCPYSSCFHLRCGWTA